MFLILRPKAKLANSVKCFQEAGLDVLGCAVIDTLELASASLLLADLRQFKPNIVIVTSTVAADIFARAISNNLRAVNDNLSTTPNAIYIGVGATTTKKLSTLGLQVIQANPPNSEGIVAVVKQLKLRNVNVAILKGSGGRKLISASLSALGFTVTEFDVYERFVLNKPFYTDSMNSKSFEPEKIQCIIATSTEIIDATYHFFDSTWLNSSHWIVVSKRTKQHLVALGANNITVSNGATDSHLIAAVNHVKGPYHE